MSNQRQRAVWQTRYGTAEDVLRFSADHAVPRPAATQVQIEVRAASINPIDWQMIEGNRRLIAPRSFPFVPLFDVAGVVVAVGSGVTRFAVGDAVHADNEKDGGGASEIVNIEQDLLSHMPTSLSFAEAAALPLAAQTALLALDKAGVARGSRVCVIGASGGVGVFAVQIARALGAASVVGVCSTRNRSFVQSLGAHDTIDYTAHRLGDVITDRSLDVVIDCVGGREQWLQAREVLAPGGRFVTISRDEDGEVTLIAAARLVRGVVLRKVMSRFGRRIRYIPVFLHASHALLDRVDVMVEAGMIQIPVTSRYGLGLDGILAAIHESKTGRAVGKLVLQGAPAEPGDPVSN